MRILIQPSRQMNISQLCNCLCLLTNTVFDNGHTIALECFTYNFLDQNYNFDPNCFETQIISNPKCCGTLLFLD